MKAWKYFQKYSECGVWYLCCKELKVWNCMNRVAGEVDLIELRAVERELNLEPVLIPRLKFEFQPCVCKELKIWNCMNLVACGAELRELLREDIIWNQLWLQD